MIYRLMIDTASDAAFAFVVMLYGAIALIVMCILAAIVEGIVALIERRRRKKFRKGYVNLRYYED